MDFTEQVMQFAKKVELLKPTIKTEEATKTSIIMPFFLMLGFDVFNPQEFIPEFTADVGIKKGEKVDYAIIMNGEPTILIEVKSVDVNLDNHSSQLYRYFGTTNAKFAILTNGLYYHFYTDIEEKNRMDKEPFLSINILKLKDNKIKELQKFIKSNFNVDEIINTASILKYENKIKDTLAQQLKNPSDDFIRVFLQEIYLGAKTQTIIEKFRPIIKKSLNDFISDTMNEKITAALKSDVGANNEFSRSSENNSDCDDECSKEETSKIITTEEEISAYVIIKTVLSDVVSMSDIAYRDTESYFGILYKDNNRKWICRLILTDTQKTLLLPDENKRYIRYNLTSIDELIKYKSELTTALNRYLNPIVEPLEETIEPNI